MICLADFPYRALVDPLLTHLAGISKDFRGKEVFSVAFSVGMSTQRAPTRALKAFLLGLLVLVSCFQFLLVFPPQVAASWLFLARWSSQVKSERTVLHLQLLRRRWEPPVCGARSLRSEPGGKDG